MAELLQSLKEVQAYLSVLLRELRPLDFQEYHGIRTDWAQVYICLRAGYIGEALQVSDRTLWLVGKLGSKELKDYIEEWADGNGALSYHSADIRSTLNRR